MGARYVYTITNSTEFELEAGGKKVDNQNRSTVYITYTVDRDSLGDILLNMVYNKIHIHTKNGDSQTDIDTEDDADADPMGKFLQVLKGASLQVVVSPQGVRKIPAAFFNISTSSLSRAFSFFN